MKKDPLDQTLLKDPHIISNIQGRITQNFAIVVVLGCFALIGIGTLFKDFPFNLVGLLPIGICMVGISIKYGVDIDLNNNRYREFNSVLFWKTGQWKSLQLYPFITILKTNEGYSVASRVQSNSYSTDELGVYLLNKSHYNKILLEKHNSLEQAKQRMTELSVQLQKEIVTYNPVRISTRR